MERASEVTRCSRVHVIIVSRYTDVVCSCLGFCGAFAFVVWYLIISSYRYLYVARVRILI